MSWHNGLRLVPCRGTLVPCDVSRLRPFITYGDIGKLVRPSRVMRSAIFAAVLGFVTAGTATLVGKGRRRAAPA